MELSEKAARAITTINILTEKYNGLHAYAKATSGNYDEVNTMVVITSKILAEYKIQKAAYIVRTKDYGINATLDSFLADFEANHSQEGKYPKGLYNQTELYYDFLRWQEILVEAVERMAKGDTAYNLEKAKQQDGAELEA